MHMKNFTALLAPLALCLSMTANAQQCALFKATPERIEATIDRIVSKSGERMVKIYGVDVGDGRTAPLHEGPIEVFDRGGKSLCKADIELLKPPFMFAKDRYFYFLSGDAIDVSIKVVDLDTCKVAWQSAVYPWSKAPRITAAALYVAGKKVEVGNNCLPSVSGANKR